MRGTLFTHRMIFQQLSSEKIVQTYYYYYYLKAPQDKRSFYQAWKLLTIDACPPTSGEHT